MNRCPLCHSTETEALYSVHGAEYVRCRGCGSGRLDPLPEADPIELYSDGYFEGALNGGYACYDNDSAMHLRNAVERLDRVAAVAGPGTHHLVDIGCASGYVLEAAESRDWAAAGVDASAAARRLAAARGHHVAASIEQLTPDDLDTVDVVTLFQVLEHMADPDSCLAAVASILRSTSGTLAIETWDVESRAARAFGRRWQQANPPSVLHLFSARGLQRALARHGFEVRSVAATSKRVSVGMVAGIAAGRWKPTAGVLRPLTHGRPASISVPYALGDLITVVARFVGGVDGRSSGRTDVASRT